MIPVTVTPQFPSSFAVSLDVFRNQLWNPDFQIIDDSGKPLDPTSAILALIIAPLLSDGLRLDSAVLAKKTFTVDASKSAIFSFSGLETKTLAIEGSYRWYLEQQIAAESSVLSAGPLVVMDAPIFPP